MKKPLKIVVSVLLLAVVLFASVPKYYIHHLSGHHHGTPGKAGDYASVSSDRDTRDCAFEKFDTPAYYTVFKFIINFLPFNSPQEISYASGQDTVTRLPYAHVSLRGPPVS